MKTIPYQKLAGRMLAALAMVTIAGTTFADETGKVRLTDAGDQAEMSDAQSPIVVRGASDIRRRNAQTSEALRQLFTGDQPAPKPSGMIQQASHTQVTPVSNCCPVDDCCPSCAAPANCCPPACAAPEACCAPGCCAPVAECCPAPTCGCPPDDCSCAPSCACPANGCCPSACDGCAATGAVHISDGLMLTSGCDTCDGSGCACNGRGCNRCRRGHGHGNSGAYANRSCVAGYLCQQAAAHRARNRMASASLNEYLHCKFGYFIHDGNGGVGSPLFGHYSIVYPVDSGYFDGRDGQVYAAQGYGGAVSVPLAPTVRQAYNYGWGIPSSRLTPVSNTTP